jgi:hypothetical protein
VVLNLCEKFCWNARKSKPVEFKTANSNIIGVVKLYQLSSCISSSQILNTQKPSKVDLMRRKLILAY